jgi:beta-carotene hydroxylase
VSPRATRSFAASRVATTAIAAVALGSLFWRPEGLVAWCFDVVLHSYVGFLGTVMAHEGSHGNLGRGKHANIWWGRLALLAILVPFANFRRTHPLHHAYTNEPGKDPDHFIKPRHTKLEIPLRALAMPHQWFFWLRARGRMKRHDLVELLADYGLIAVVWVPLTLVAGPERVALTMLPSLALVSFTLWYPFAFLTHEGYSTGDAALRSHDYYGKAMYWLSLGLSMHRAHHMHPQLTWRELERFVTPAPGPLWRRLVPRRHVVAA